MMPSPVGLHPKAKLPTSFTAVAQSLTASPTVETTTAMALPEPPFQTTKMTNGKKDPF